MATMADRILWVIESRRVESARAWCVSAGVAGSYLGTFLSRARAGQPPDMGVGVLQKLAEAAHVSFAWLAVGVGLPEDELLPTLPPNLRSLVERHGKAYPDVLVQQAVLVLEMIGEKDLTEEHWQDYLDGLKREARRLGLENTASKLDRRGFTR